LGANLPEQAKRPRVQIPASPYTPFVFSNYPDFTP
jgi:hypothetical protein